MVALPPLKGALMVEACVFCAAIVRCEHEVTVLIQALRFERRHDALRPSHRDA